MEKITGKIFIFLALVAWFLIGTGCTGSGKLDLVRKIAPLETREHIVHDLNSANLPMHSFDFRWHLSDADEEAMEGNTGDLDGRPHVCANIDDINKRNAWVRAMLPIVLEEVLSDTGIPPMQKEAMIQGATMAIFDLVSRKGAVERILESYYFHSPGIR